MKKGSAGTGAGASRIASQLLTLVDSLKANSNLSTLRENEVEVRFIFLGGMGDCFVFWNVSSSSSSLSLYIYTGSIFQMG